MPLVNDSDGEYFQDQPAVIPAAPTEAPEHSALDIAASAFRQNNLLSNLSARFFEDSHYSPREGKYRQAPDPTFDPLDHIKDGYDFHWRRFLDAQNLEEVQRIKSRISEELRSQQVLEESGAWGHVASFAAGAVDPATLASMMIPGGAGLKGAAMVGAMVGTNATIDTLSELAMHQLQETRTLNQSLVNIGAGALLTGTLGTLAARIPSAEREKLIDEFGKELYAPNTRGASVGAAAAGVDTTLEQEGIAGVGRILAKTIGQVSPLTRVLNSNSRLARQVVQDLAEVPYTLTKNAEGIATPTAAETIAKSYESRIAKVIQDSDDAYKAYHGSTNRWLKQNGKPLTRSEFREQVAFAMRNGDEHPIPEVAQMASRFRSEIVNPLTKELQDTGLLVDPVKRAQARLDEDVVHEFMGSETQRLMKAYIAAGGDQSEARTLKEIQSIQLATEAALKKVPPHLKGLDRVHFEQKIRARAREDLDKIEPHLADRLINRAKAVFEGRATDADAFVNELATLMKKRADNEILDKLVPRQKTEVTGFDVVGARSYLPRLYDVQAIKANRAEWDRTISHWLMSEGIDRAEAQGLTADVTRSILGSTRGFVDFDPTVVAKAGNLQERTLRVPDNILEPFLVNDVDKVLGQYVRSVGPQIALRRKFANDDLALTDTIRKISDEYAVLQNAAKNSAEKSKLEAELASVVKDITEIRDRILGKAGVPKDPDSKLVRGARLFRDYNYVRLLGAQVFSSLADVGRIMTQYGLVKTAGTMARFASDLKRWKLAREDAKRLGIGLDWVLNTRGSSFAEIGEFAETRAEEISRVISSNFSRITGMATWNSSAKFLAAALQQDEILKLAKSTPTPRQLEQLAALGIDKPMLARIAKEFDAHGVDEGLRRARSELWKDKEAASVFEAAILKASDTAVLTKGAGDTPILLSSEMGKTLLQFKGFGLAAVNRLLIPVAQGLQRRDIAVMNGMAMMLALGVLRYFAKQWTADQPIDTDPSTLMREAIDGSGFASLLPDVYDPIATATGLPRFSRYTDRNPLETALGPTYGTATDLFQTAQGLAKDGIQPQDIHRLRKLMPLQNLFYVRRAVNALEESIAE